MMRRLLLLTCLLLWVPGLAQALPRFTLTTSSRCSNCHVNPQGSGPRNEMGFYSTLGNGAVGWDKLGWQKLHDLSDNTFLDGKLTVGGDLRLQMAKLGAPRWGADGKLVEPSRLFIPMQDQIGAAYKATAWLTAAASFNPLYYVRNYAGQTPFDGWLQVQPSFELPRLRLGMIQPGFGVRYDDHTLLIRRNPYALGKPIVPPMYNDLGAEVSWEGLRWLSVDASVTYGKNLALANPDAIDGPKPVYSGRLTLYPETQDWGFNTWLGASMLMSDKLTMRGAHFGIGKSYWGTIMAEAVMTDIAFGRSTVGMLAQASHPLKEWLVLEGRWERTSGYDPGKANALAESWVAGIQFIPLPYVELRPEYRWLKTDTYKLAQYTLQMHFWF